MGQKRVALVQDTDPADWIISFGSTTTDQQLADFCVAINSSFGAECHHDNGHPDEGGVPFDVFRASPTQLEQILQQYPNADFVEHDDTIYLDDPPEPPTMIAMGVNSSASSVPWGLDRIDSGDIDDSYTSPGAQGAGVHVYVLDTGVRTTHSDFEGRAIPTLQSLGSLTECADTDTTCADDTNGHGTHCSGTIAGKEYGVAKQASIHAVKVMGNDGRGSSSWLISAMQWVIEHGIIPRVMSMSLGGPGVSEAYRQAVNLAVAAGVTVVVAAGNANSDACNFSPAFVPSAITVGSTTSMDKMSSFSNFGSCVDIFAPGSSILSASCVNDYDGMVMSGTSMACPHVAGATAILLGEFPDLQTSSILSSLLLAAMPDAVDLLPESPASPNMLLRVTGATSPPTPAPPSPPPTPAPPTPSPTTAQPTPAPTPFTCDNNMTVFRLELTTDTYGGETGWTLEKDGTMVANGGSYGASQSYVENVCIVHQDHTFTISDTYGDGMCCNYGPGSYKVFFGGALVKAGGEYPR